MIEPGISVDGFGEGDFEHKLETLHKLKQLFSLNANGNLLKIFHCETDPNLKSNRFYSIKHFSPHSSQLNAHSFTIAKYQIHKRQTSAFISLLAPTIATKNSSTI